MLDNLALLKYKQSFDHNHLKMLSKKGIALLEKIIMCKGVSYNIMTKRLHQDLICKTDVQDKYYYISDDPKSFYKYGDQIKKYLNPRWKHVLINKSKLDYSNKNSTSLIKQGYLDGLHLILDKYELALLTLNKPYVPYTIAVYKNNISKPQDYIQEDLNGIIFLKQSTDTTKHGEDIYLFDKRKDTKQIIDHLDMNKKWVLQREVRPPKLLFNKKFDIRIFVLGVFIKDNYKFYISKYNFVKTAKDVYQSNSTKFTEVVSHLMPFKDQINLNDYFFLYNLNNSSVFDLKGNLLLSISSDTIKDLILKTINLVQQDIKTNNDKGFIVMGYDIVMNNNNQLFLIEINQQPYIDIESESNTIKYISEKIINNLANNVIDSLADDNFPLDSDIFEWIYSGQCNTK